MEEIKETKTEIKKPFTEEKEKAKNVELKPDERLYFSQLISRFHNHELRAEAEKELATATSEVVSHLSQQWEAQKQEETVAEIDKLVVLLKKYPKIQMELRAHTDSRGESKYNLELSNQRAQAVVSYMISKGVDQRRLTAKGFGDTEPLNECKKGISCPEVKHRLNRRVEFRISKFYDK